MSPSGTAGLARCGWKQPRCAVTAKRHRLLSISYSAATSTAMGRVGPGIHSCRAVRPVPAVGDAEPDWPSPSQVIEAAPALLWAARQHGKRRWLSALEVR